MTWGAIGGSVAGAVLGGIGGGGSQGGTQTQSKEPWAEAAPWLKQNIQTGQDLQNYYQHNLFNQQQQNAYGNLSQGTNYMNQLVPGLLSQISGQPGFDRSNPLARQRAISFPGQTPFGFGGGMPGMSPGGGNMNVTNNPFANGGIQAPVAAAPVQASPSGSGWDQSMIAKGGFQFMPGEGGA